MGGKTSYGTTSGTTKSEPWTPQQPYLGEVFKIAQDQFYNGQPQYFPGSTVAPFSPQTSQGLSMMESAASNPILPGLATNALAPVLQGQYLGSIPGWQSQLTNPNAGATNPNSDVIAGTSQNNYMSTDPNAYIGQLTDSISREVIPQIQSNYAVAGRTGSSPVAQQSMAKGITDALAPYAFGSAEAAQQRQFQGGESEAARAQAAAEAQAARMFSSGATQQGQQFMAGESGLDRALSAYGNERDRMMQGISQAPTTDANRYTGAEQMMSAGSMYDALNQAMLSDEVARWDYGQNAPITALENYASAVQGGYGGTTSSSGVSPTGQTNPFGMVMNTASNIFGK